jgi:putative polyketide hydroxylase
VLLTEDERWCPAARMATERLKLKPERVLIGGVATNSTPAAAGSTLDIPIERIAADPAGKSVLDAILPQVMGRANYETFKSMSQRQLHAAVAGADHR